MRRRAFGSCVVIGCLLPGANAVLFYAERNVPIGLASLIDRLGAALGRRPCGWRCGERLPVPGSSVSASASPASRSSPSPRAGRRRRDRPLRALGRDVVARLGRLGRLPMPADSFAATSWEMLAGGS